MAGTLSMRFISVVLVCCAGWGLLLSGCSTTTLPRLNIEVPKLSLPLPIPLIGRGEGDYQHMSWVKSFDAMHAKMVAEYPYSAQKGVDWDGLYGACRVAVKAAAATKDEEGYYLAVRRYLYGIPDAQVKISVDRDVRKKFIGGDYGFSVVQLDDGRVFAYEVMPRKPADLAGMEQGAEILLWDDRPVEEALVYVDLLWVRSPLATEESRRIARAYLLTRGPVEHEVAIGFRNPGDASVRVQRIMAWEHLASVEKAMLKAKPVVDAVPLEHQMVGNVGVIKINFIGPSIAMPFPIREFDRCMEFVLAHNAQGVILDLRGNPGGVQALACSFAGYFLEDEVLFSDTAYVGEGDVLVIDKAASLRTEHQNPHWTGPLVVLVDHRTTGAAEGLASVLQRNADAKVVGFSRSQGAYGVTGGGVKLPKGHTVFYPVGAYMDVEGAVLLEGDGDEQGGVKPDHRVPWTVEALYLRFVEGEDVVMSAAIDVLEAVVQN